MMEWRSMSTESKINAVRLAFKQGATKSAGHIASILSLEHGPVTRNAVIGLIFRHGHKMQEVQTLGINYAIAPKKTKRERRSPVSAPRQRPEPKRSPAANVETKKGIPMVETMPETAPADGKERVKPKTLLDLGFMECKFIVEGTGHSSLFCAEETDPKSSWCAVHKTRVFMPTQVRLR